MDAAEAPEVGPTDTPQISKGCACLQICVSTYQARADTPLIL